MLLKWAYALTRFSGFQIIAAGLLFCGFLIMVVSPIRDYMFLSGAAYTDAQFVRITESHPALSPTRLPHTEYIEQYTYIVKGQAYFISQSDTESNSTGPEYNQTMRIAYKTADPSNAVIISGQTLQIDARNSVVDGLVIGLGGTLLVYIGYLISRLFNKLRRKKT